MYLGIDIGGTSTKYSITDDFTSGFQSHAFPSCPELGKDYLLDKIYDIISSQSNIESVGIGIPGIISNDGIIRTLPNLKGWDNFNFKEYFLDKYKLPVYIDNDANIAALAELLEGAGKDLNNFIYVTLGTGIGGSIIINKQIYRGDSGSAGEIGHVIIDRNAKVSNELPKYRTGIVEEFAGRNQIISMYKDLLNQSKSSVLASLLQFDVKDISDLADSGDAEALIVIINTANYISLAIISAMNLLDIHNVIIGGGISKSVILIETIRNTISERALPQIADNFVIENAKFQSETGIIGALIAAKKLSTLY